jgi:hypothetical protein
VAFFGLKNRYAGERLTVSTSSIGLTSSTLDNVQTYATDTRQGAEDLKASAVVINVVTSPVYYTLDGSIPSASNGNTLAAGATFMLAGYQKIKDLRFVRNGGADATVVVDFYKG